MGSWGGWVRTGSPCFRIKSLLHLSRALVRSILFENRVVMSDDYYCFWWLLHCVLRLRAVGLGYVSSWVLRVVFGAFGSIRSVTGGRKRSQWIWDRSFYVVLLSRKVCVINGSCYTRINTSIGSWSSFTRIFPFFLTSSKIFTWIFANIATVQRSVLTMLVTERRVQILVV